MSDYNSLVAFMNHKMSTAIIKYPTGKYGIVGSVPIELTIEKTGSWGMPYRDSITYETEKDVINALLGIGMTRFQLSNCNWYDPGINPQ